jgi:hypothetical protein
MGKAEQEQEELEVFKEFLRASGQDLQRCTFEKRPEPEPDIFLKRGGRAPLAYELAQLVDPKFKERLKKNT